MSLADKEKWDLKYIKKSQLLKPREASKHLKNFIDKCSGNKAIDLACGAGRNSIYLAKKGFDVDAVDIAMIALDTLSSLAKDENLSDFINTIHIDLDKFTPEQNTYDLALMANFLDRELIEKTKSSLKKNGIFIIETYMIDEKNEKENSDPENLLKKEELKEIFSQSWEIIFYDEFDNEAYEIYQMKKQVIVAKKLIF